LRKLPVGSIPNLNRARTLLELPDPEAPAALIDRHPYAATASSRRFMTRGFTIAGGSSEVQHELLAKQVLGL
jgi:hypothetical protein